MESIYPIITPLRSHHPLQEAARYFPETVSVESGLGKVRNVIEIGPTTSPFRSVTGVVLLVGLGPAHQPRGFTTARSTGMTWFVKRSVFWQSPPKTPAW